MFWPIHAIGRYASTSSFELSASISAPARPAAIRLSYPSTTPFGVAGRARCVEHRGRRRSRGPVVISSSITAGCLLQQLLAARAQCLVRLQARLLVMAQTPGIVIKNLLQVRDFFADLEHLVDLLLVLDHRKMDLGVIEYERHLGGGGILVHRYRYSAETLHRRHREIQPRAVLTDDRQVLAAFEAGLQKPGRDLR